MTSRQILTPLLLSAGSLAAACNHPYDASERSNGPVAFVIVSPREITLILGTSWQLRALLQDAAHIHIEGRNVDWSSSVPAVATVSTTGLVTGVTEGIAIITAASEGQTGSAIITVHDAVFEVLVTPRADTVAPGGSLQLTASIQNRAGTPLNRPLTWSSVDPRVASVSNSGLVTGLTPGVVTIAATSEGVTGNASIAVQVPVAQVRVTPASAVLDLLGGVDTLQLKAIPLDAAGNTLSGRLFEWASANPVVATVNRSGLVTALALGSATITATSEGRSGSSSITVGHPSVAAVTVSPASVTVLLGRSLGLTATVTDSVGNVLRRRLVTWSSSNPAVATVDATGQVTAVGEGSTTITATSEGREGMATVLVTATSFTTVTAGGAHSCGLTSDGTTYCWGYNDYRQVGAPLNNACSYDDPYYGYTTVACMTTPSAVGGGGPSFSSLAAGANHSCGSTGSGVAYCWGANFNGQLGNGTSGNVGATPTMVSGGYLFATLDGGGEFTCGLTPAGAAYCWGWNGAGQLGDGSTAVRFAPVAVTGGHLFMALSVGGEHACGVTSAGALYCWGNNFFGQLGNASRTASSIPTLVSGLSVTDVSAGSAHTCALSTTGTTYCWGYNDSYQVGAPLNDACGYDDSYYGHVTLACMTTPWVVAGGGGPSFTRVATGGNHSCGIAASGAAYCWGANYAGELGNGTSGNIGATPTAVYGGYLFGSLSLGASHTCGRTAAGIVYCWGAGNFGQLGQGSTASSSRPVKVLGQP